MPGQTWRDTGHKGLMPGVSALALARSAVHVPPGHRKVSRPDDRWNPCDAVADRTQDALGLIDSLLPGCASTLPRRGLLLLRLLSLTGVNFRHRSRRL